MSSGTHTPTTDAPTLAADGQPVQVQEPAPLLTVQELSTGFRDLSASMSNIQRALDELLQRPVPPPPPAPPAASAMPTASAPPAPSASRQGVPITELKFPPSPSQLPSWATAPTFDPGQLSGTAPRGGSVGYAPPSPSLTQPAIPPAPGRSDGAFAAASYGQQPPRFAKLEFFTYDDTVDPLN